MKRFAYFLAFVGVTAHAADEAALVSRYLQYQALPRITKEKIDVAESVQTLCTDPKLQFGPHIKPGIHIYANEAAIKEKKKDLAPSRFPIGSLFVKEKFESKDDAKPSIITVMEKVSNHGKVDDWKFFMIRISDQSIVRNGFKVSCVECHSHYASSDFVSPSTNSLLSTFIEKKKVH